MPGNETPKSFHLDKNARRLVEPGRAAGAPDDLLTTKQLAHWLGYAVETLERCASAGTDARHQAPRLGSFIAVYVIERPLQRQVTSTFDVPRGTWPAPAESSKQWCRSPRTKSADRPTVRVGHGSAGGGDQARDVEQPAVERERADLPAPACP